MHDRNLDSDFYKHHTPLQPFPSYNLVQKLANFFGYKVLISNQFLTCSLNFFAFPMLSIFGTLWYCLTLQSGLESSTHLGIVPKTGTRAF